MKANTIIIAAAILISTSAYGQQTKIAPQVSRVAQTSSARDTYLITKHTSVFHSADDSKNDPWAVVSVGSRSVKHGWKEEQYTITHGAKTLRVRYSESQTNTGLPSLPGPNDLHYHSVADSNPDLSQIPKVGTAILGCVMDGDAVAIQPTPRPCISKNVGNTLTYWPSPNSDGASWVRFDILSGDDASTPPTIAKPQSPTRKKSVPVIAKEAQGSVVSVVMSNRLGKPIVQGSGFLVSRNGIIVTNYHVIKTGISAVVKLPDGSFFPVDGVLAYDKDRDIAVIKARGTGFKKVALGDSDQLQVGEEVVAIGSPLSLESTVSNGIVSGIRSDDPPSGSSLLDEVAAEERRLLQITAPISHGSSGGPLFNMFGQVVGITSAALVGGENLNFAIPINDAKRLLESDSHASPTFPDEPEEVAHEESAQPDNSSSLVQTEQWMNKFTVAYAQLKGKGATVLSFDGCSVTEHDFMEFPGPPEELKEIKGTSYTLSDIDPAQISVKQNLVEFANTDGKKSINHSNIFYSGNWMVLFDNSEHAGQFIGGFKHAVELCGGQKSKSAVVRNVSQADGENLCRQAASAAAERFSKLPFLHDGATQWDYDYHYGPTNGANPNCFIWFRSAHRETFTAPGAIPKQGLRFEDSGFLLQITSGSNEANPEILHFESAVLDKGTDTEVSRVFDCEVDDRTVHAAGSKTQCQTWEQLRNLVDYEFGIKYTGRLR